MNRRFRGAAGALALAAIAGLTAELTARADDLIRHDMPFLGNPDQTADLQVADTNGVRGRPNGRYLRYRMNNHGFRGASDVGKEPAPGCTRVLVLGASETFGAHEPTGMEYPAQLERRLDARGRCHEVLNAGLPGMSLRHIMHTWVHHWRFFEPDYVVVYASPVFYLTTEDLSWPDIEALRRADGRQVIGGLSPRLMHRAREAFVFPAFIQRRRVAKRLERLLANIPADSVWQSVPPERLAAFRTDVDSLLSLVEGAGARPVLVTHARRMPRTPEEVDAELLAAWRSYYPRATPQVLVDFDAAGAEAVREVARARGVPLADADCVLSGRRALFGDFVHFTADGAGIMARTIADAIEADEAAGRSPRLATVPAPACGADAPRHALGAPIAQ